MQFYFGQPRNEPLKFWRDDQISNGHKRSVPQKCAPVDGWNDGGVAIRRVQVAQAAAITTSITAKTGMIAPHRATWVRAEHGATGQTKGCDSGVASC